MMVCGYDLYVCDGPFRIKTAVPCRQSPEQDRRCRRDGNDKDKIYLTYTTGHPDNEMPNWLYFNVVDINHGNGPILKDIKGNTLQQVADGVFRVNKSEAYLNQYPFTVVDHTPGVRNWVWQIAPMVSSA